MSKICKAKHTDFQPKDKDWKCPNPNCGSNDIYFYEDDGHDFFSCDLLHNEDCIVCNNCDGEWTGKELSELMKVEKKKCPCCDGTGWIVEK